MQLVNFARRDMMLYKFMLSLRYETTPDQLRYVLAKVREMLLGHPKVTPIRPVSGSWNSVPIPWISKSLPMWIRKIGGSISPFART